MAHNYQLQLRDRCHGGKTQQLTLLSPDPMEKVLARLQATLNGTGIALKLPRGRRKIAHLP